MKSSFKNQAAGAAKKLSGSLKQVVGKIVNNEKLEASGVAQEVEGTLQKAAGDIQQAIDEKMKETEKK